MKVLTDLSASLEKNHGSSVVVVLHSRCSELTGTLAEGYLDLLPEAERARNKRFLRSEDRNRNLLARVLLRSTLAELLHTKPYELAFDAGEHGKPQLCNGPDNLHFNLSHTANYVVLAISAHARVGIDIEMIQRSNDVMAIADRYFFGRELEELHNFPQSQQRDRFFDYWTLKEAYMKARGEGISLGLDNFGFSVVDRENISIEMSSVLQDNPDNWCFHCGSPEEDYRLALAYEAPEPREICTLEVLPESYCRQSNWSSQLGV